MWRRTHITYKTIYIYITNVGKIEISLPAHKNIVELPFQTRIAEGLLEQEEIDFKAERQIDDICNSFSTTNYRETQIIQQINTCTFYSPPESF